MQDGNEPAAQGAVRLIFERNGDALRLVLQQPVDVTVARFDVQADVRPGHYVEIRDAAGMTLSRVPVRSAFSGSREVFPEDHSDPITRVDTSGQSEVFTVVVPAPAASVSIAVVRIAPPAPTAGEPGAGVTSPVPAEPEVTELATFPIEPAK
jgi:hypothetical protein